MLAGDALDQNFFRQNSLQVDFGRLVDLYTQATGIRALARSIAEFCFRKTKSLLNFD
jgi:hypothetical protein